MEIKDTLPDAIKTWIQDEHRDIELLETLHVTPDTRSKTQEEVNFSGYRELAHTGLYHVTVTFSNGDPLSRTFTKAELEGASEYP